MENCTFVSEWFLFGSCFDAEFLEIFGRFGGDVGEELEGDAPGWFVGDGDVEEDFGVVWIAHSKIF